mmetsp:Transcript_10002/g.43559  ORF Transcript_10002/g.43559 Transcript_10002/m.43559 type:complete len:250 (+) Transcript_10002:246-995(+)
MQTYAIVLGPPHARIAASSGVTSVSLNTTSVASMISKGPSLATASTCASFVQSNGMHLGLDLDLDVVVVVVSASALASPRFFRFLPTGSNSAEFRRTFLSSSGMAFGWSVSTVALAPLAATASPSNPAPAPSSSTLHRDSPRLRFTGGDAHMRPMFSRMYCSRAYADSHTIPPHESCRLWSCSTTSSTSPARDEPLASFVSPSPSPPPRPSRASRSPTATVYRTHRALARSKKPSAAAAPSAPAPGTTL